MAFSDLVASLDASVQSAFSDFSVTIHTQSPGADYVLSCVTKNPKLEDDYQPGTPTGAAVLLLFVHPDTTQPFVQLPARGDTATVDGVDYDIFQVDVDREGGMTLRMRKRSQPWYK
jgi:hypothetical protein